jgi:Barrel-sandwich domain of CusB or HlyD membrane-fusion
VREGQAVTTELSPNAKAITYWVVASEGWQVVTTVDTVINQDSGAEQHAVVRFSVVLLPEVGVKVGETAARSATQPLLLVGDVSALRVRAELDERDFAGIKIGQAVVVRAAAFPGRDFAGKVASIAPTAEPARINPRGTQSLTDFDVVEVGRSHRPRTARPLHRPWSCGLSPSSF